MLETEPLGEVKIKIENRQGTNYLSCDDLPGLWLWGSDLEKVLSNVIPAIEALYKQNENMEVRARAKPPGRAERWSGAESVPQHFLVYRVSGDPPCVRIDGRQAVE